MLDSSGLSRRELEVARLVAQGLTNREIAERLHISERTADGHMEHIRDKLGVSSRVRVAAWVVRQETVDGGRSAQAVPLAQRVLVSEGTADAGTDRIRDQPTPHRPNRIFVRVRWRFALASLAAAAIIATMLFVIGLGLSARLSPAAEPAISTVAGSGVRGFAGDSGSAVRAELSQPSGIAVDGAGIVYVIDGRRVRRVAGDGTISTFAGTGNPGFSGDGAAATLADLNLYTWSTYAVAQGLAVDKAGNLYIGDLLNHRVRRVEASTGVIATVVGDGREASDGDGGLATNAALRAPVGLAVSENGDLFIADAEAGCVRKVDTQGIISTVSTGLDGIHGIALDLVGNVYVAATAGNVVRRIEPDGRVITIAGSGRAGFGGDGGRATRASLNFPSSLATDKRGNLYIADSGNNRIRRVDPTGTITTLAGTGSPGFSGDVQGARNSQLNSPLGVATDGTGGVYVVDTGNNRVRKITLK